MDEQSITSFMLAQIKEIEQRDEDQVLAELAGETIEEYIYEIKRRNPKTKELERKVKLSWIGTREVARSRGNIVLEEPIIIDLDDAIRFVVKATDLTRNFTVFGGCHQPRKQKINIVDEDTGEVTGERYEEDLYCFQKGLSKSQRNALTLCIPGEYTAKMIDKFLTASGGKSLLSTHKGQKPIPRRIAKQPAKTQIKPREEWEKITPDMVPDYPHLEPIIWNLCKLQPSDMYRELGVGSRNDMTIPAWDAFLSLKECFAPLDKPSQGY